MFSHVSHNTLIYLNLSKFCEVYLQYPNLAKFINFFPSVVLFNLMSQVLLECFSLA